MTGAPVGAEVGLYYDSLRYVVEPGDLLVTGTGRTYLVRTVRIQRRGRHRGRRKHLRCIIVPAGTKTGGRVHPLRWYRRRRKGAGG